jgi:hypothetical protein
MDSDSDEKSTHYRTKFESDTLKFNYNKKEWRQAAITHDWFKSNEDPDNMHVYRFNKRRKKHMNWFYFQLEAYAQRRFVLDNLPPQT